VVVVVVVVKKKNWSKWWLMDGRRANAEDYKAQMIVDYYANRFEQRRRSVQARATNPPLERSSSSSGRVQTRTKGKKGS